MLLNHPPDHSAKAAQQSQPDPHSVTVRLIIIKWSILLLTGETEVVCQVKPWLGSNLACTCIYTLGLALGACSFPFSSVPICKEMCSAVLGVSPIPK